MCCSMCNLNGKQMKLEIQKRLIKLCIQINYVLFYDELDMPLALLMHRFTVGG